MKLLLSIIEAMKLEYRRHLLYLHDGTMDSRMEEMGEDGWELINVFKKEQTGDEWGVGTDQAGAIVGYTYNYYFKRLSED